MWVKLDDGYFRHPKARRAGKDGRALFIASVAWSNANLLDGVISKDDLPLVAADAEVNGPKTAALLVKVGHWETTVDGWLIHDYHDYNPTAEKVREVRAKRAEAGARGGKASKPPGKPEANCLGTSEGDGEQTGKPTGTPSPVSPSGSSSLHRQTSDGAKPDDDDRFSLALDAIVDDLEAEVTAAGKPPTHPDAWRRKVRTDVETRYGPILAETLARPENATGDIRRLADTARQTCDRPVGAPERSVWPSPAGHWETDADGNATEFVVDPAEPVTNGAPFTLEPFGAS